MSGRRGDDMKKAIIGNYNNVLSKISLVVLALMLGMLWSVATVFSADLDAPVQKKITVRSEIKRGSDALFDCRIKRIGARECLQKIKSMNQQNNTDTEPFLLGLYFHSWVRFCSLETDMDRAKICFEEYRKRQLEYNMSDELLCEITGLNYEVIKPLIDNWIH
jgi:hypothetical protein